MRRLEATAAWFFTCLGTMLLAIGVLVTPAEVFADSGDDCLEQCAGEFDCMLLCCQGACQGVESCVSECMQKGAIKCKAPGCQTGFGCTAFPMGCEKKPCNDDGIFDPAKAKCHSLVNGCRCR